MIYTHTYIYIYIYTYTYTQMYTLGVLAQTKFGLWWPTKLWKSWHVRAAWFLLKETNDKSKKTKYHTVSFTSTWGIHQIKCQTECQHTCQNICHNKWQVECQNIDEMSENICQKYQMNICQMLNPARPIPWPIDWWPYGFSSALLLLQYYILVPS